LKEEELDNILWRFLFGGRICPKRDYSMKTMEILKSRHSPSTAKRKVSARSPYNCGA